MKKVLAFDYDGTISIDKEFWLKFAARAKESGYHVVLATMRYAATESLPTSVTSVFDEVVYTERRAKREFLSNRGVYPDIWIDDQPEFIVHDASH